MVDFTENMRRKGKAEEDMYFAELDRKLIEALHEKQTKELKSTGDPNDDKGHKESPFPTK